MDEDPADGPPAARAPAPARPRARDPCRMLGHAARSPSESPFLYCEEKQHASYIYFFSLPCRKEKENYFINSRASKINLRLFNVAERGLPVKKCFEKR